MAKLRKELFLAEQQLQKAEESDIPIRVAIVCDSIPKYVTDIRGAEIIPFKGININGVSAQIQNKSLILDKEFTIFHVGTNDIPHLDKGPILSSFNNLIAIVRGHSKTKIVFSSVLP